MITVDRRLRYTLLGLVVSVVVAAAVGCASGPTTIEYQGDYPAYDRAGLVSEATLVVEGAVVRREHTVFLPRYEGSDPPVNPMAGRSEAEQQKAIEEDGGIAMTLVTVRVSMVHRGRAAVGKDVVIAQTGGVVGNVTYRMAAETPLEEGSTYLLFATDSRDGAFAILGGSAGTYRAAQDGTFAAVSESAPFDNLSITSVADLLRT